MVLLKRAVAMPSITTPNSAKSSASGQGPIQGSLVLFLIPDDASENRPLELVIPGDGGPATVELDL